MEFAKCNLKYSINQLFISTNEPQAVNLNFNRFCMLTGLSASDLLSCRHFKSVPSFLTNPISFKCGVLFSFNLFLVITG